MLTVLVENAGEIVGHRELIAKVWPGAFVEEVSLRVHIAALRKALDTGEAGPRYLTNVPGRGYGFVAPTSREAIETPDFVAHRPAVARYALPARLTHVVGRDDDVRELCEAIVAERFVTLVGPGGMGKTTVALSVAHALLEEFRGAICFVELGPLNDPHLLAGTVASAFGLPVQTQDPIPGLVAHLRGKRMLLILDSSEHLISAVAVLAGRLFEAAPDLHILATSREALRTDGENVYRLSPLASPPDTSNLTMADMLGFPAAKLFVERAAMGGGTMVLDDTAAPLVANICRRLGGLALAIELAAGRVGTLGLRETAALLDSQFALRWPGRRTAPPRHQTLSATLDWSYNLLSETERKVLARLSAFAGNFTLEGAQQVAGRPELAEVEVFDAIGGLFVKSLASADTSGPIARYRLLDTTRTYAAMKLKDSGEYNDLRRRHALYYRDLLVRTARGAGLTADQPTASAADIDNIRAALHWAFSADGDPALGVDLAAFSTPIWLGKALLTECRDWMTRAAAVANPDDAPTQQQLLIQTALASSQVLGVGMSDQFKASWTKALELAVRLQDIPGQLTGHLALWGAAIRAPSLDEALDAARRCGDIARLVPDPGPSAMVDWMAGVTEHHLGRLADARLHLRRALDTDTEAARLTQLRQIGYDRRVATIGVMANVLWLQGYFEQARQWGERALAEARSLEFALPVGVALTWAGLNKYLSDPDIDAVERDVVELVDHSRTHAIASDEAFGLCLLGLCQAKRQQFDAAMPLVMEGLRMFGEIHYEVFTPFVLAHLCEAAIEAKRHDDARSLMTRLARDERNPKSWCTPEILRVKGMLALTGGDQAAAAAFFSQSIESARTQGALAWELRAATSLGRLHAAAGRPGEALDLLAPVFERFAEGADTADLVAAGQFLDELRSSTPAR
ncbi:MAG: winged helix-turn-helix domain-containing protein [Rhizomicrobium sp.]